jgi:hypothetical protein
LVILATAIPGVAPAGAHPAYEGAPRLIKTASGNIEVVKSYIDGIMMTDPAKLVVRSGGAVLFETPYYRDTSLVCGMSRCLIVAAESPFALIPEHTWVLEGSSLRRADSFGSRVFGTWVHLWDHKLGYLMALLFAIIPFAAMRQVMRASAPKSSLAGCLTALVAMGAAALLLMWFYAVVMLSELWLPWTLLLAVVPFFGGQVIARWRAGLGIRDSGIRDSASGRAP